MCYSKSTIYYNPEGLLSTLYLTPLSSHQTSKVSMIVALLLMGVKVKQYTQSFKYMLSTLAKPRKHIED